MPTVAVIDGMKIRFYNDEHPPAHFHAVYAEHIALIDIDTLKISKGHIPPAQYRKVRHWAQAQRGQLMQVWLLCRSDQDPGKIA